MKLRIKELAKERGITITSLAEKSGVTQATLSNTINEKSKPSFEALEKIAYALEVEMWELFTKEQRQSVSGFLKIKGNIYEVSSKEDIEKAIELLNDSEE